MVLTRKNIFHHNIALVTINTLSYGYNYKGGSSIYEDGYYNVCNYIQTFRINFTWTWKITVIYNTAMQLLYAYY